MRYYIAMAGNIASWKTNLELLSAKVLGWLPVVEDVEDHPFLSDYFSN